MDVLALQPYDAGAHRAFLAGWQRHSRHRFTTLSLPGRHFKWRMRQAPIDFAQRIDALAREGGSWDALWCTSMLDLAALRGLCTGAAALPTAVYFHENQLAYPARYSGPRDIHFGLTNMTTALAAAASLSETSRRGNRCVWWNSAFNRDSFLDALDDLLRQMPDHAPTDVVNTIRQHSAVHYPGIDPIAPAIRDAAKPPHLLWAARWEHDKNPELFFEAIDTLIERGIDFKLSVIGEQFGEQPACFDAARERFGGRIVHWGFQPDRQSYEHALREASLVISTARHEFFGLAVAEAVSAGCLPVLPDRLAYPEVWGDAALYHDQTPAGVADAIERAVALTRNPSLAHSAHRFAWPMVAKQLDSALEQCLSPG